MNIFVAKLNYDTTSDELREAFEQFGEVSSAKVIQDHDTGRSKGFGFVEMPDDDAARQAISSLDNSNLAGNDIVVKEARPREERPRNFGGGGHRGGGGGRDRRGGGGGYRRDDRDRRNKW